MRWKGIEGEGLRGKGIRGEEGNGVEGVEEGGRGMVGGRFRENRGVGG